jgi:hypothetical protein
MENKELIEEMRKAENHISEIVSYFEDSYSEPAPCQTYVDASNEADEAIKQHPVKTEIVDHDTLQRAWFLHFYANKATAMVKAELAEKHIVNKFVEVSDDGTFYDRRLRFLVAAGLFFQNLINYWGREEIERGIREDEARRNAACAPQAQG